MLTEQDPLYPNWDQDATALEDRYQEQLPAAVVSELTGAAEAARWPARQHRRLAVGSKREAERRGLFYRRIHLPLHDSRPRPPRLGRHRQAPVVSGEASGRPRIEPLDVQLEGVPQLNIFLTLAKHRRLYDRFSRLGGFLLYRGLLPARPREIVILRTGWRSGSVVRVRSTHPVRPGGRPQPGGDPATGDRRYRRLDSGGAGPGGVRRRAVRHQHGQRPDLGRSGRQVVRGGVAGARRGGRVLPPGVGFPEYGRRPTRARHCGLARDLIATPDCAGPSLLVTRLIEYSGSSTLNRVHAACPNRRSRRGRPQPIQPPRLVSPGIED